MKLIDAYNAIRDTLLPQVQGTCALYSFHTAVCLLRHINSLNPDVPTPKKCEAAPQDATESLRQYAKREFKSGQGEILSELEMAGLVTAWGYKAATFLGGGYSAKCDFIFVHMHAGHPVLVPYLATHDDTGVVATHAPSTGLGAHWSLIVGIDGKNAQVIEPNDPRTLRTWPMFDLLRANLVADRVEFPRYWAKIVANRDEYDRQTKVQPASPKVNGERYVSPVADAASWEPTWDSTAGTGEVKLYDLGGDTGQRQGQMKLKDVLVAIVPPNK